MTCDICTVVCGGDGMLNLPGQPLIRAIDNKDNRLSPCQAYQQLLEHTTSDIIIYTHDDVAILDPDWLNNPNSLGGVLDVFAAHPLAVAVGLGGATSLGRPDLYRKQYNINNMARGDYASNQEDAEVHGERFTGVRQVAVLDAFFMALRVPWLRGLGGWPVGRLTHHCLDLWIACEASRSGKEVWMTGLECVHYGGRTSTKQAYAEAKWLQGGDRDSDHSIPHRWLFDTYRDVLPIRIAK